MWQDAEWSHSSSDRRLTPGLPCPEDKDKDSPATCWLHAARGLLGHTPRPSPQPSWVSSRDPKCEYHSLLGLAVSHLSSCCSGSHPHCPQSCVLSW